MSSVKHNTYLPGYKTVAHHEWRTVENSAPHLLPPLEALAAKNPNLKLLDVGAGSGTITASIVKYMPSGHITAVDLSPEIVSRASAHAEQVGVASNITFQAASVYELSQTFGENAFDVVHASQMLCHLDSPVEALTQMLKVVKPGGVLALREIDMRVWSCYPDTETMRAFHRVQLATHKAAGGSNAAGPSLVSWAMKAGAKREDLDASMGAWMYSTPEEREVWGATFRDRILGGEMRKKALELGVSTEAELNEMGAEWQRWIDTEDATCGTIHGQLLVTKACCRTYITE